jgi:hypothetical protein
MGRLCYPTQHPGSPEYSGWYFSQKFVTVQEGYGTCFCRHGTNFITGWRDRGISYYKSVKEAGTPACRQAGKQKP